MAGRSWFSHEFWIRGWGVVEDDCEVLLGEFGVSTNVVVDEEGEEADGTVESGGVARVVDGVIGGGFRGLDVGSLEGFGEHEAVVWPGWTGTSCGGDLRNGGKRIDTTALRHRRDC